MEDRRRRKPNPNLRSSNSQLQSSISQMDLLDLIFSFQEKIAQHEQIHFRAQETIERFLGVANDRLVFVERSVEHERDAGEIAKVFDQPVITRVGFFVDGLQTP